MIAGWTPNQLVERLTRFVTSKDADQVTLYASGFTGRHWRFSNGHIPQAQQQDQLSVHFRILKDRAIGIAGTSHLDGETLDAAFNKALLLAKQNMPLEGDPPALPQKHLLRNAKSMPEQSSESIAAEANQIQRLFHLCQGIDADLSGSMTTGLTYQLVMNSAGTIADQLNELGKSTLIARKGPLAGFGAQTAADLETFEMDAALERAMRPLMSAKPPQEIELGDYEVILEPEALADLLMWMAYTAFGAKSYLEGHSFLSDAKGSPLTHESLTIYDDGNEDGTLKLPFDSDGELRQRVVFIDKGAVGDIVCDHEFGKRLKRASTGHALPFTSFEGPYPMHLGMEPGQAKTSELIANCSRGLYIPRFHYVNGLLDPKRALMSGLTREGCMLIEDGQLKQPVTPMRFTQGILEAFQTILGVSGERRLVSSAHTGNACALLPAIHLGKFRFTHHAH